MESEYPMYTIPLQTLLTLKVFKSHEELRDDGTLVKFHPGLGKAMFVSHQWISDCHPDPHYQQLTVLQDALRNVLSGTCRISTDPTVEAFYGRAKVGFSLKDAIFVWYDYLCCPQLYHDIELDEFGIEKGRSLDNIENQEMEKAIESIPFYVAKCKFFVALCPTLTHADNGRKLDQHSWAQRGWCRAEKMARELSAGRNGLILLVESPRHLTWLPTWEAFLSGPGSGQFAYITDLKVVGGLVKDLLTSKLQGLLETGDLCNYRFYLNQQHVPLRQCPVDSIAGLVPGNHHEDIVDRFLYENGLVSVHDRDPAGWSCMCYAAINGNPKLITRLLEHSGDPNDRTLKGKDEAYLAKWMPLLSLCAYFSNNDAIKILLEAKANPNQRDGRQGTPMFWANLSDNLTGTRLLLDFKADPLVQGNPPLTLLEAACTVGAVKIASALLRMEEMEELRRRSRNLLHLAFMVRGGSPEFISTLLQHSVDVNERWCAMSKLKLLKHIMVAKHRICGPSTFSSVFYHVSGSTPLMLAILSGSFASAELLLEASACVDLQNSRKRTALDFAAEKQAPMSLLLALRARGGVSERWFLANASLWREHADWSSEVQETTCEAAPRLRLFQL